jgi:hypothetical protein
MTRRRVLCLLWTCYCRILRQKVTLHFACICHVLMCAVSAPLFRADRKRPCHTLSIASVHDTLRAIVQLLNHPNTCSFPAGKHHKWCAYHAAWCSRACAAGSIEPICSWKFSQCYISLSRGTPKQARTDTWCIWTAQTPTPTSTSCYVMQLTHSCFSWKPRCWH